MDEGKARSIGVSNFDVPRLKTLLDGCRIRPAVNQVEMHPFLPQKSLLDYCTAAGIHVTAYSPLGCGGKTPALLEGAKTPSLLSFETVVEVAKKEACTPAQALLAWAVARGTSVVPKSVNAGRLAENLGPRELSPSAIAALDAIDVRHRFIDPQTFWRIDVFGEKPLL